MDSVNGEGALGAAGTGAEIPPVARVILIGFMASGKSSVGRMLARRLGWAFSDVDRLVEAEEGRTIAEIFRDEGEAAFRELEGATTARLLTMDRVVIAAGGGWPAVTGRMEGLAADTLSVWLPISPDETVRRAKWRPGVRPLLEGPDPLGAARELLAEREPYYRLARVAAPTERRSSAEVVDWIVTTIGGGR